MSGLLEQAVVKESKCILLFPVIKKKNDKRYATEHVWYGLLVAILKFR